MSEPRVRVTTMFREVSYAPQEMVVEIDDENVSVSDIVAILRAMGDIAYGPTAAPKPTGFITTLS